MSRDSGNDHEGWIRDAPLHELIESGITNPLNNEFTPGERPGQDSHDAMFGPYSMRLCRQNAGIEVPADDKAGTDTHASHRRKISAAMGQTPSYVILTEIPGWQYQTEYIKAAVGEAGGYVSQPMARVFRREGQKVSLDIAATLCYIGANNANENLLEILIEVLGNESDFDNVSNQKIMQEMFQRANSGEPSIIEGAHYTLFEGPRRDPKKLYIHERTIRILEGSDLQEYQEKIGE